MKTIQEIYQQATLAQAAYIDFYKVLNGDVELKFALDIKNKEDYNGDFTETQANTIAARYTLIDQYSEPATLGLDSFFGAFSASVFQDKQTGDYTFAIRGTAEYISDLYKADVEDLVADGLAMDQIVGMYNYWQSLNHQGVYRAARLTESTAETAALSLMSGAAKQAAIITLKASGAILDSKLGGIVVRRLEFGDSDVLLADTQIATGSGKLMNRTGTVNVAGHSLGGHLSAAFSRLFSNEVNHTTTINGAGYPTGYVNGLSGHADHNIAALFSQLGGASQFPSDKITNIHGDGINFITMNSEFGLEQQGAQKEIYLESSGFYSHSSVGMTNSLAVYNLLASIDSTLNQEGTSGLSTITNIIKAGSNQADHSLESIVAAVGKLFNVAEARQIQGNSFDSDQEGQGREQLYAVLQAIDTKLAENKNSQYAILDLSLMDSSQIVSYAQNRVAVRYALVQGNNFAVAGDESSTNALYSQHNQNGELDLYTSSSGKGLTESWLKDRAEMLYWQAKTNIADEAGSFLDSYDVGISKRYYDAATNKSLYLGGSGAATLHRPWISFGDENGQEISGATNQDKLYGMGGDDTLDGNSGNGYLEGGAGVDTYIWTDGDGFDTLWDSDGRGRILIDNGSGNLGQGASVGNGQTFHYESHDGTQYRYIVVQGDIYSAQGGTLLISNETSGESLMHVLNYRAGDLGLTDSAAVFDEPESYSNNASEVIKGDPTIHVETVAGIMEYSERWDSWDSEPDYPEDAVVLVTTGIKQMPMPLADGSTEEVTSQYELEYYLVDDNSNPTEGGSSEARSDYLRGTTEDDHFMGEGLNDRIVTDGWQGSAGGNDILDGGDGHDILRAGELQDQLIGGGGSDKLFAGAGDDELQGGQGTDLLYTVHIFANAVRLGDYL